MRTVFDPNFLPTAVEFRPSCWGCVRLSRKRVDRKRLSGAVVLEVLLALPLLLIALIAIVEFGIMWSNMQAVEMAARSGAQVATRYPLLPASGPVPVDVQIAVRDELARIGVDDFRIRIDHNVDYTLEPSIGAVRTLNTTVNDGPTSVPDPSGPVSLGSYNRPYVRVIVYTNTVANQTASGLAPNLLKVFGVDFEDHVSQATEVRRYAN